jgi:hypothetical protein
MLAQVAKDHREYSGGGQREKHADEAKQLSEGE